VLSVRVSGSTAPGSAPVAPGQPSIPSMPGNADEESMPCAGTGRSMLARVTASRGKPAEM
jgi:hypothetical protein